MSDKPLVRTCQNCAAAKIRCARSPNVTTCDRCQRLNKFCEFRQARRRFNGTRKDHRIEELEAKVNQLLDVLPPLAAKSASPEPSSASAQQVHAHGFAVPAIDETVFTNASMFNASSEAILPCLDAIGNSYLDLEHAEVLLQHFKAKISPHFPFVLVPQNDTADSLRHRKPFLLLAILAAASFENMPLQRKLGRKVKEVISDRMIMNGEVSFELLQGLLVHLAWCQYHSRPRQYTQFLQLAISIIVDLRLDRPLDTRSWKVGIGPNGEASELRSEQRQIRSWGDDEQRAVAGCYYLCSSISMVLRKLATFRYSVYIEECCERLSKTSAHPTDRYIPAVIQLQHILEKIDRVSVQTSHGVIIPDQSIELQVMGLRSELEAFKEKLPFAMWESELLGMQFHTAELCLYQISIFDRRFVPATDAVAFPPSSWRLQCLCSGLIAAKSLLAYFILLPLRYEMNFSNTELVQVGFAMTIASRLSIAATQESIAPETKELRRLLDMPNMLKQLSARVDFLITTYEDENGERDVWYHYGQRVKRVKQWYEDQLHPQQSSGKIPNGEDKHVRLAGQTAATQGEALSFEAFFDPNGLPLNLMDTAFDQVETGGRFRDFFNDNSFSGIMGGWASYPTNNHDDSPFTFTYPS